MVWILALGLSRCRNQHPTEHSGDHGTHLSIAGTPVQNPVWNSSVALVKNNQIVCSGVLVKPQIVLTAAHCIADMKNPQQPQLHNMSAYGVYMGQGRLGGEVKPQFGIQSAGFHGSVGKIDALPSGIYLPHDLGYVVLDRPMACIRPAQIVRGMDDIKLTDGKIVAHFVGFGPSKCHFVDNGVKRSASSSHVMFDPQQNKLYVGDGTSELVCPGDSGGGAFVELANGDFRLIGILSGKISAAAGAVPDLPSPQTSVYEPLFADSLCWAQSKQPLDGGFVCPPPPAPRTDFRIDNACPQGNSSLKAQSKPNRLPMNCAVLRLPQRSRAPGVSPGTPKGPILMQ